MDLPKDYKIEAENTDPLHIIKEAQQSGDSVTVDWVDPHSKEKKSTTGNVKLIIQEDTPYPVVFFDSQGTGIYIRDMLRITATKKTGEIATIKICDKKIEGHFNIIEEVQKGDSVTVDWVDPYSKVKKSATGNVIYISAVGLNSSKVLLDSQRDVIYIRDIQQVSVIKKASKKATVNRVFSEQQKESIRSELPSYIRTKIQETKITEDSFQKASNIINEAVKGFKLGKPVLEIDNTSKDVIERAAQILAAYDEDQEVKNAIGDSIKFPTWLLIEAMIQTGRGEGWLAL